MVIKDLDLNQQHHPLLNACRSLASTTNKEVTWHSTQLRLIQLIEHILSGEKTGLDIFLGDDETGETFQQVKTLISATKTQHIFHSICQYLQLQYERQTKDDNSFENYRLRIFWLGDSHCSDVLPILDLLLNLSQQTVPNGLLLLLELVHVPLYFDLIFGFNDQWWSSFDDNNRSLNNIQRWTTLVEQIEVFSIIESTLNQNENDDNNNSFGDILSSLLPCSNIRIFDIRYSTLDTICFGISVLLTTYKQVSIIFVWQLHQTLLNSSPYFYPFVYVLTDHAQFNNDSNLHLIPSPFIGLARSLITEYERHRLQLIDLLTSLNNNN
ncbi:unnamed protein product [Adineta steineri]|uniref:Uncharacterized protein n=1 Tax=Adineta steineri TaxID=433720 RepID=A0A814SRZ0_9BILA|nr:unnamed protein product [Adineta steineri]